MTGDLNMNDNLVTNCGRLTMMADGNSPINMNNSYLYGLPNRVSSDNAANKTYVDNRDNLNLPLNGSRAMTGNIDMNNHMIKGLSDGNENDDAVNVKQLNEAEDNLVKCINNKITDNNTNINSIIDQKIKESETSSIDLVDQENVFKNVMDDDLFKEDDDDIHKIGVKNKDFHLVNKKTYEFKIDYDSAIGYYSARLSIDLIYLDAGNYTMVFEMYVEDGITIDQIEGTSGTLSGITTKSNIDGTKTRSIIHFSYNGFASGFNDLNIDIKLKSKNDPKTTIYVVVYGVKGNINNVSVGLWDRLYYYDNDSIKYEVPIDMKGKKIKGVGNGSEDDDAVNVKQLNKAKANYNNTNPIRVILNYLLKDDNKFSLFKELYFPDSHGSITSDDSNVYSLSTRPYDYEDHEDHEDQLTLYYVFQHKESGSNEMKFTFSYLGDVNDLYISINGYRVNIRQQPNFVYSFSIPNNYIGKQLWFWIWINNDHLNVIHSGFGPKYSRLATGLKNLDYVQVSGLNLYP